MGVKFKVSPVIACSTRVHVLIQVGFVCIIQDYCTRPIHALVGSHENTANCIAWIYQELIILIAKYKTAVTRLLTNLS